MEGDEWMNEAFNRLCKMFRHVIGLNNWFIIPHLTNHFQLHTFELNWGEGGAHEWWMGKDLDGGSNGLY